MYCNTLTQLYPTKKSFFSNYLRLNNYQSNLQTQKKDIFNIARFCQTNLSHKLLTKTNLMLKLSKQAVFLNLAKQKVNKGTIWEKLMTFTPINKN